MKRLFTFMLVFSVVFSFAQRGTIDLQYESNFGTVTEQTKTEGTVVLPGNWSDAGQVGTYQWTDENDNPIGWIFGNNSYGDKGVGQLFPNDQEISVEGAYYWMSSISEGTNDVHFKIFSYADGAVGDEIASKTIAQDELVALSTDEATPNDYESAYYVEFDAPVNVTGDYVMAIIFGEIPYSAFGDGIGMASTIVGEGGGGLNHAHILDSEDAWVLATSYNAALDLDLGIFPVVGEAVETNTVVDVIVNSEDHNTLEAAVLAADLAGALSGAGPFTVFAPTDAAFDALPEGTLDALLDDPEGALTNVLLYHVVEAEALSSSLSDGDVFTTMLGQDITVTIDGDGNVFINDAQVITADVPADNGVVHVIDAVLVPEAQEYTVTFNVDMADVEGFDPATHDVYIAGSFPGDLEWNEPGTNDDLKLAPVPTAKNDPPLNLYDNFDSYDDFAVDADLAPWSTVIINDDATWGAQDFDFPGEATTFGFMAFNPAQTDPAVNDVNPAFDGEKYLIAIQSQTANDNKWLMTPEVSFNSTSALSFHVRSITVQYGMERFRVLVSTTDMETASFTQINDGDYLEAPVDWTEFTFDLSEFDGETGYIAIQYVSDDAFIFMLDAFSLTAEDDGNGGEELLYTIDLPVTEGTLEYKYSSNAIGDGWDGGEWPGDPNREITVTGDMVQNDVFGVYDPVSVENILAEEGLNLFPNPVRENLTIDAKEMINQVRIFDPTGRVVLDDIVNDTQLILNVSDFRQGAYLIQVTTESGVMNKKFNVVK